jgi:hypothetical protein
MRVFCVTVTHGVFIIGGFTLSVDCNINRHQLRTNAAAQGRAAVAQTRTFGQVFNALPIYRSTDRQKIGGRAQPGEGCPPLLSPPVLMRYRFRERGVKRGVWGAAKGGKTVAYPPIFCRLDFSNWATCRRPLVDGDSGVAAHSAQLHHLVERKSAPIFGL